MIAAAALAVALAGPATGQTVKDSGELHGMEKGGTVMFHCGGAWLTFPRAQTMQRLPTGKKVQGWPVSEPRYTKAPLWVTVRKADIEGVHVAPLPGAAGSLAGAVHVRMKGRAGLHHVAPRSFHRLIVECLD